MRLLYTFLRRSYATLSCGLILACGIHERSNADGQAQTVLTGDASTNSQAAQTTSRADTNDVRAYLTEKGYALDQIVSIQTDHVAALATVGPDSIMLLLLEASDSSFRVVSEPRLVGGGDPWERPTNAEWVAVTGSGVDAFIMAWDDPSESLIGATVYVRQSGQFRPTYDDPTRACRSAEFVDIGSDGTPELVTFVDDLSDFNEVRGDPNTYTWACFEPECSISMMQLHGVAPAWTGVWEWSGSEWVNAEHRYTEFYEQLAEKYSAAAEWVSSLWEYTCAPGTEARLLEWAARAQQRASGGDGESR